MSRIRSDSDVFQAIADPTRRRLLEMLERSELAVKDMGKAFPISQPALSKHLRVLRQASLVRARKEGLLRVYRLDPAPLRAVAAWITRYERFWNQKLDRLESHLEKKHARAKET